jgi:hypothetical protein
MKRFSILTLALISTLILSACGASGAQTTPTVNAVDIQSTMAAAAFTMVAETQAAIPTATPIPPTETPTNTPFPTNTLPPLDASGATLTPVLATSSGGTDPCVEKAMPTALPGRTVKVRINNSTRAELTFSIYLNQTTPQGECGYRTYTIPAQQPLVLSDLVEGCYTLWAWNPIPEDYFIVTNGTNCLNSAENWVFEISTGSIKLRN